MGKKPFLDKKASKHYHVVHRSQKDPLINDSEAPDRVLQEVLPLNQLKNKTQEEIDRVKAKPKKLTQDEIDQRIGQAALYGIYYDDSEYDYTQHLKPIGAVDAVFLEAPTVKKEKPKTMEESIFKEDQPKKNPNLFELPSDVLPSNVEMSVGVMNQSTGLDNGLQPDMDPRLREVLEALSDEEYIDEALDDDFFEDLNAEGEAYDPAEDEEVYEDSEEEEHDEENEENYDWEAAFKKFKLSQQGGGGSDDEFEEDRQSRATGFSVSSSAMHRNTQLRLLDDRFEKIEEEYAEEEDEEEEIGGQERADFDAILDDFLDKYEIVGRKMQPKLEGESSTQKLDTFRQSLIKPELTQDTTTVAVKTTTKLTREALEAAMPQRPTEKKMATWDCQTIISTYSNLENHPSLINDRGPQKKIKIDPKTGMPVLIEVERKQKKKEVDEEEEEEEEEEFIPENKGVARSKTETKEEKKARKIAAKEARKNRREEKKTNRSVFKNEENRQKKILQQQRQAKAATHIP
ncbi:hypothetical protein G6F60_003204 [Rhizopus arrhizus]|nr:hypothetical protein G6F60_003204 [Rhizopus arrhizus]